MKRSALPFFLAAILALVVGFSCQHDPSIEGNSFVSQLRTAVKHGGFSIVTEEAVSKDDVPLPLSIRWHPRRWHTQTSPDFAVSNADGADRFSLVRDRTSRVECFVRYLEGRAQFVLIRANPNESLAAMNLRSALTHAFPDFPIQIEIK